MAEQRTRIKIACGSLAESDRAPLVSAINSAQRRISADLVWASAQEADIHITDADRGDPAEPESAPERSGKVTYRGWRVD